MGQRQAPLSSVDRRRFLEYTWNAVGAGIALGLSSRGEALDAPRLGANPFTLGVASGDPTPDGIVLWTRLAPEPRDPSFLGKRPVPVRWRIARDERMRHQVAGGWAVAPPELAHSVHVEVKGLRPGRDYFYQFEVRGEESPVGRFRTAPERDQLVQRLRFAFATCQDWPSGY
jgi:alkaline phosphatase D